jgi:hypothetical protein
MPDCHYRLEINVVGSFIDKLLLHLPRYSTRETTLAPVPRLGIILKHMSRVVTACSHQVHPQTKERTQQRKLSWQPDQSLVRKSFPSRITETILVDAFLDFQSRGIGSNLHQALIWINWLKTRRYRNVKGIMRD